MEWKIKNGKDNTNKPNGLKSPKNALRASSAGIAAKTALCAGLLAGLLFGVRPFPDRTAFWLSAALSAALVALFALWMKAQSRLRVSDTLAAILMEATEGCCWEWSFADGRLFLIPDGSLIFGKSVSTFDGFLALIHPDDVSAFKRSVEGFYAADGGVSRGESLTVEFRIQSAHGQWRWFAARSGFAEFSGAKPIRAGGGFLDIDEYWRTRDAIRKSETRLSVIFRNAPGAMAVTDSDGKITVANQAFCDMLGYSAEALQEVPIMSLSAVSREKEGRVLMEELRLKLASYEDRYFHIEEEFVRLDGERVVVDYGLSSILDHDGNVVNYIFSGIDVTLQKKHAVKLDLLAERERDHARRLQKLHALVHSLLRTQDREQLLKEMLDYLEATIPDSACTVYLLTGGKKRFDSPKLERLAGYGDGGIPAPDGQVMKSVAANTPFVERDGKGSETRCVSPIFFQDRSVGAVELRKPSGMSSSELDLYRLLIDYVSGFWTLYDLLAQREEEASVDPLTGIWNRRYMIRRLQEENDRITRYGGNACLVLGDMGNFKFVNDNYGHNKGDEVLIKAAATIRENLRVSDNVGRYGGDEFLLLLTNIMKADAEAVLERIGTELSQMKILSDDADPNSPPVSVVMDFGMAFYPHGSSSLADVIALADEAMYANKTARKERLRREQDEQNTGPDAGAASGNESENP
jgi:diguanylate cyclase (GGDEF)-like protein/PAS domain S-box-containing protein